MRADPFRLGALSLRVPGLGPEAARRLGEDVARALAAGPPDVASDVALGALAVRLELPPSQVTPARIAAAIVRAIEERGR